MNACLMLLTLLNRNTVYINTNQISSIYTESKTRVNITVVVVNNHYYETHSSLEDIVNQVRVRKNLCVREEEREKKSVK